MKLEDIIEIIRKWSYDNQYITKVWLYGSRTSSNYRDDSDLDVAIEIQNSPFSAALATWICDSDKWKKELQEKIPLNLHLELYEPGLTPNVEEGLKKNKILIFSRYENTN